MYSIGAFLIDTQFKALMIHIGNNKIISVCPAPGFPVNHTQGKEFDINPATDRLADAMDIAKYQPANGWPQWVKDIQQGNNFPLGSLPLTIDGFVDHKPRAPAPTNPNAGRVTLQMFQETCVHKFVTYTGFSRVFEYCTFCDLKKLTK